MTEELLELGTEDLIEVEDDPPPMKLPAARRSSNISITPASGAKPAEPPRPRFVPTALARPIKERSRQRAPEKVEDNGNAGMVAKAASFFEQALEAQKEGDVAAAVRHVKLALTFDPNEPRYLAFLSSLKR